MTAMRIPWQVVPRSQRWRLANSNNWEDGVVIGLPTDSNRRSLHYHCPLATKESYHDYLTFRRARKKVYDGERLD